MENTNVITAQPATEIASTPEVLVSAKAKVRKPKKAANVVIARKQYTKQVHTFNARETKAIIKSIETEGLARTVTLFNTSFATIRAIADEAGVVKNSKRVHEFNGKEKVEIVRSIKAIGLVPTARAFNTTYYAVRDIAEARGIEVLRGRRALSA